MNSLPKLFIKQGCPWCREAVAWLDQRAVAYQKINVLEDAAAFEEMKKLSGQSKTPTLQLPDGRLLADFGVEELPAFLGKN